jgi:hypothetical protein
MRHGTPHPDRRFRTAHFALRLGRWCITGDFFPGTNKPKTWQSDKWLTTSGTREDQSILSQDPPCYSGAALANFLCGVRPMLPSFVTDLKTFVPAKDPELSKQFYIDLGFTINWSNEQIAELQIGSFRFLLQTFYVAEHAGNFMMSLAVEDADAWWEHIQRLEFTKKYPGIMCKPPQMQPWGIRVLYLSDPSGVLWHITDQLKS